MTLLGNIVPVDELPLARRGEMFELMTGYYDNIRRDDFDADLAEKDWVIEVADRQTGALCGFSTQMVFPVEVGGRRVFAMFSGDTIVDERYRRQNPLAGLWGRLALRLSEWCAPAELYWFLISKGYKTYRFLPVFFRDFFPRFDRATPRDVAELIDAFGRRQFPGRFDANTGLIHDDDGGYRLRPGAADVTPARLRDPHVRFFCERNPGHAAGDELCCVAPIRRDNFRRAAWKLIDATAELPADILTRIDGMRDDRHTLPLPTS